MSRCFTFERRDPDRFIARWTIAVPGERGVYCTVGTVSPSSPMLLPQSYHFEPSCWQEEQAARWVEAHYSWYPPPNGAIIMATKDVNQVVELKEDLVRFNKVGRVDAEAGIVQDVKILGLDSAHNRAYTPDAMKAAIKLYEGVPVNVNHPGPDGRRLAQDRFGMFKNVRFVDNDGLRGDLHYNPKHPFAAQFGWAAEHQPTTLGSSHDAFGGGVMAGGKMSIREIKRVRSVDIVAEPATTKNLYESRDEAAGTIVESLDSILEDSTSDPAAKLQRIEALRGKTSSKEKTVDKSEITMAMLEERPDLLAQLKEKNDKAAGTVALKESLDKATKELDALKAKQALADRKGVIDAKLTESKLPAQLITDLFRTQLLEAKDDATVTALIEERKTLAVNAKVKTPQSKETKLTESTGDKSAMPDVKSFSQGVRKGVPAAAKA